MDHISAAGASVGLVAFFAMLICLWTYVVPIFRHIIWYQAVLADLVLLLYTGTIVALICPSGFLLLWGA